MTREGQSAVVTGGASFIGSHLVRALVARGARVLVADDFSTGRQENLAELEGVEVARGDLRNEWFTRTLLPPGSIVFHLAARHGGRGYVDRHQARCAENLILDGVVFRAAVERGIGKVVYASSGCVYPLYLQRDPANVIPLAEGMVGPFYEADNMYGWAKLMGEMTLRAFHAEYGLKAAIGRFFTVYGERGYESHAITAMVARAFLGQDPLRVWGDGSAIRNWTHVDDIVRGLLLLAERVEDATAVNLGTTQAVTVRQAAEHIAGRFGLSGVAFDPTKPVGPLCRVADNRLAEELLGWTPEVEFFEGLDRLIAWYRTTQAPATVKARLEADGAWP